MDLDQLVWNYTVFKTGYIHVYHGKVIVVKFAFESYLAAKTQDRLS